MWGATAAAHVRAAKEQAAEPAFSDEEFEGSDRELGHEGGFGRPKAAHSSPAGPKDQATYEVDITNCVLSAKDICARSTVTLC